MNELINIAANTGDNTVIIIIAAAAAAVVGFILIKFKPKK